MPRGAGAARAALLGAAVAGLLPGAGVAGEAAPGPRPAAAPPGAPPAVGQVVVVARPTMVRTRGGGNLSVDLPRGRAVVVRALGPETALLEPAPADADLLRQFGVRRVPLYTIPRARLDEDFVDEPAWRALREASERRIRDRWPDLGPLEVERILLGDPFVGMTRDQAEEAVGPVVFARETRGGAGETEEVWTIGRRPRAAELRAFTEGRERGLRAATFDDYLRLRARAVLMFRSGRLAEILPPPAPPPPPHAGRG